MIINCLEISNTLDDILILQKFFEENKNGQKSFRYFINRPFEVIKKHMFTGLFFNNNDCVGYGHLDNENDTIWLGIMVSDKHIGKGFGSEILKLLISKTDKNILLSVDLDNTNALNLYLKHGFVILEENNKHYKMFLKK